MRCTLMHKRVPVVELVSSFEWIVFEKLKDAGELIRSVFQQPCQQKMM